MNYTEFINDKWKHTTPTGIVAQHTPDQLFPFQKQIVGWSLSRGRSCIFADCGMGKTPMQLAWADEIPGRVLIVSPLAVAQQTVRESEKFGIESRYSRSDENDCITITNYEMLKNFDPDRFTGIVIDESSILKSYDGKMRTSIIDFASQIKYRLACTATPAPNDFMELGNHSEYIGSLSRKEMLSKYFVHDGGRTSNWRIKGHALKEFWRWVSSWAIAISKPADMNDHIAGFELPELIMNNIYIELPEDIHESQGTLFPVPVTTLNEQRSARRGTIDERINECKRLIEEKPNEPFVVWCELNTESDRLEKELIGSVQISGSDTLEYKEQMLLGFSDGEYNILITKPSIAGFGMNWQHCANMIFFGVSHSYEMFYQCLRRSWRFGQNRPVTINVIMSTLDEHVLQNLTRKEKEVQSMKQEMKQTVSENFVENRQISKPDIVYEESKDWRMYHGDCVEITQSLEPESVDYSIFSPPFASLYTYTDSVYDMGNCSSHDEFVGQFTYLIDELFRVIKSGRLVSFHCMNLPTQKSRDGVIGIRDFRGELIRLFVDAGFIYHSEVCIWKDPVTAMQRTKALGLLHKQIRKDSAMCRQGIADYLVTMRKPGDNEHPISHTAEEFPVAVWQRYASPVWMDINPSDTLQYRSAREEKDEKHICPLQLGVIRRAIDLWTNINDVVLSPFAGIGSEGYVSVQKGRRFVGAELKESYFKQSVGNLKNAETMKDRPSLFDVDAAL
tara:strand:- start:161 stop:2356 length:2196 start_codon:yes stop_codon:yes gene_type:complete